MKPYKWLLAVVACALCLTGCNFEPPPLPLPTSTDVKFVGVNQVQLAPGQNLKLVTVKSMCNFYQPDLPGPFISEVPRTLAFDGERVILTKWFSYISYRVTTGEIVDIVNGADTQRFALSVDHVGDKDQAYDGNIAIERIRKDAVLVTWFTTDTHVS